MNVPQKISLGSVSDFESHPSKKFTIPGLPFDREGFVIFYDNEYFAYYNECSHISLALDWDDNDFLDADTQKLICKNHGAQYDPKSGLCTAGPCTGVSLKKIPLLKENGELFAII